MVTQLTHSYQRPMGEGGVIRAGREGPQTMKKYFYLKSIRLRHGVRLWSNRLVSGKWQICLKAGRTFTVMWRAARWEFNPLTTVIANLGLCSWAFEGFRIVFQLSKIKKSRVAWCVVVALQQQPGLSDDTEVFCFLHDGIPNQSLASGRARMLLPSNQCQL